jgi:hypothetical protein
MKASAQRRRSKGQIKEEKKEGERKQNEVTEKLAAYKEMEAKVNQAQALFEEKEHYRQLCGELYDNGIIKQDADGSIVAVDDPVERESIRTKSKQKTETQL